MEGREQRPQGEPSQRGEVGILPSPQYFTLTPCNSITENELVPLKTQLEEVELHIEEEVKFYHQ